MSVKTIFTNPNEVGSFSTLHGVLKNPKLNAKLRKKDILKDLQSIDSFVQHKPILKKFKRRRFIIHELGELWAIDLAQLDKYSRQNSNFKYILGVIEGLSKKVFLRAIKKKTALAVRIAFEDIVKEAGYTPRLIHADRGSEWKGVFKDFLREKNIKLYHTITTHSVLIERFWRTLKNRLETYMTYTGKKRWVDILPYMASSYNQTKHSSTNFAPNEVTKQNEFQILHKLYDTYLSEAPATSIYKVGDIVKLGRNKLLFEKSSTANFTKENFRVSEIINTKPITYKLVDFNNEPIQGQYYAQELALFDISNGS